MSAKPHHLPRVLVGLRCARPHPTVTCFPNPLKITQLQLPAEARGHVARIRPYDGRAKAGHGLAAIRDANPVAGRAPQAGHRLAAVGRANAVARRTPQTGHRPRAIADIRANCRGARCQRCRRSCVHGTAGRRYSGQHEKDERHSIEFPDPHDSAPCGLQRWITRCCFRKNRCEAKSKLPGGGKTGAFGKGPTCSVTFQSSHHQGGGTYRPERARMRSSSAGV